MGVREFEKSEPAAKKLGRAGKIWLLDLLDRLLSPLSRVYDRTVILKDLNVQALMNARRPARPRRRQLIPQNQLPDIQALPLLRLKVGDCIAIPGCKVGA